jgi:hypothetical protein
MRWLTGFMCLLVLNIVGCGESLLAHRDDD